MGSLTLDELSNVLSDAVSAFTMRISTDAAHVVQDGLRALDGVFGKDVGRGDRFVLHEMGPFCQRCYLAPKGEGFLREEGLLLRVANVGCHDAFEFELICFVEGRGGRGGEDGGVFVCAVGELAADRVLDVEDVGVDGGGGQDGA